MPLTDRSAAAATALALLSLLAAAPAVGNERCLAAFYRLPANVAAEMRPYVVCGLFRERDGHFQVRLNGTFASMRGGPAEACNGLRQSAMLASETRLAASIPDAEVRREFVVAEFEKADRFLAVAAGSEDLTVGEEPASPRCRTLDASD